MAHGGERMKQKRSDRFVKLYFRNQKKVMQSIPEIMGLVSNDVLVKVYTLDRCGMQTLAINLEDLE